MFTPEQNTKWSFDHAYRHLRAIASMLCGLAFAIPAYATPFESCPSRAFLIQDSIATLYGVNLATGFYSELSSDMGTRGKINALAFNFHDNYLYGWGYEFRAPVRISSDFQATPLDVENLPGVDFYVGDISVERNTYYVYRSGSSYGLYAIDLDPSSDAYLAARRIADGQTLNLQIYDLAFHPDNTFAYAVDRSGNLYQIDVNSGSSQRLSNVGTTGTFGATYFDADGFMYIGRNSDGYVYRIDITQSSPVAEFYAYGPSSSNNDGARCALAPIVSETDSGIDFGDAPASYGTSLAQNGARHDIGMNLVYLGQQVDGESDAYLSPLSDDTADRVDDEDGVQFVTGLELGGEAILIVEASTSAFLNAWVDWDRNGVFDDAEQVAAQASMTPGQNNLTISTPLWASTGATWARFRLSSTPDVGATGGVSDGEVEDYEVRVTANGVTESVFPSAGFWSTLAYEDNWPLQGDYDMNDLVVHVRNRELRRDDRVLGIEISGELVAVGGIYHNGFAIRLPGVSASALPNSQIEFWINNRLQSGTPVEAGQDELILIIANDTWDYVSPGEGCVFYRTEAGCESPAQMDFTLRASFGEGVPAASFPAAPYDPFMFATDGYGRVGFDQPPGRGLEVHLPGQTPTDAFDRSLLGRGDDRSDENAGKYFLTETGMPWAMHVASEWFYPFEFVDIAEAYPLFESFVRSAGATDGTWYLPENAVDSLVFMSE